MSSSGLLLGGTVNSAINPFARTGRGLMSCTSCIFEVLLEIKVAATYALGSCNWYFSLIIMPIDNFLDRSVPKLQVRESTLAIIRSGM